MEKEARKTDIAKVILQQRQASFLSVSCMTNKTQAATFINQPSEKLNPDGVDSDIEVSEKNGSSKKKKKDKKKDKSKSKKKKRKRSQSSSD